MGSLQPDHPRRTRTMLTLLLIAALAACTRPPAPESGPIAQPSGPPHSLSRDEADGGHTLRKHVGRSDAELRQRLQREPDISAASTWNDRESAESAVGTALAEQSSKISRWLARENGHPNLVLDYDGNPTHPFGRTLRRGEDRVELCAHAVIVLKRDGPDSYHILTAYPECRP
jgi:hypothetical protein